MSVFKLTVLTVAGLGAAMTFFGRDEGLPDDRIGRDTQLFAGLLTPGAAVGKPKSDTADALAAALRSDASPETATIFLAASEPEEDLLQTASLSAAQKPEAEIVQASLETEAAPEPEAAPFLYVTGSRVNVRGGPSTSHGVINSLGYGTAVEDLGDAKGGWRQIRILETGERGFMSGTFLTEDAP